MIFSLALFFLSLLVPGYLILAILRPRFFSWPDIFFAYGLGSFFLSGQIFIYLYLLRLNFSLPIFGSVLVFECLLLFFSAWRSRRLTPAGSAFSGQAGRAPLKRTAKAIISILVFLTALNCFFVIINAAERPPVFFDSMAMWSFKAKALFYQQRIDFNPADFYYLGGGAHLDYPPGVPLAEFWLYELLGRENDLTANFIFAAYFISLLGVFFYLARKFLGMTSAWILAFFLSSLPLLFLHGSNAYADLPLTFYVFIAFVFWLSYLESGRRGELVISGVFWAAAAFAKDTAWLFILPGAATALIIAARRKKLDDFWRYIFGICLLLSPWLVFSWLNRQNLADSVLALGWHPQVIGDFFRTLFWSGNWNLLWFFVVLSLLVAGRRIRHDKLLVAGWIFSGLALAATFALFIFSGMYIYAADQTAISRILLVFSPICLFLAGLSLRKIEEGYFTKK